MHTRVQKVQRSVLALVLSAALLTACSPKKTTNEQTGPAPDPSRLVPEIVILGPATSWVAEQYEANRIIAQTWESLGVKVKVTPTPDWATFVGTMAGTKWHASTAAYIGNQQRIDPFELLTNPFLCRLAENNGSNYGAYCNPKYDELINKANATMDQEERRKLVIQEQEQLAKDLPVIVQYYPDQTDIYNKDRYKSVTPAVGSGLFNFWNFIKSRPEAADGTIRIGLVGQGRSINPFAIPDYNWDTELHLLVYDTLARVGEDGKVVPWAAESWSANGNTVRATLRKGMTFTDGKPVTANDVKFSFDNMVQYKVPYYVSGLSSLKETKAVDDLTVEFTLNNSFAPFYSRAFATVPIVPKHIWEPAIQSQGLKSPADWKTPNYLGSGPYSLVEFSPTRQMVLKQNPAHFSAPKADQLVATVYADPQAVFLAMQKGDVDFHAPWAVTTSIIEQAKSQPQLHSTKTPGTTVRWMTFNLREGSPFRDYAFRLAFAQAVDYKTITTDILKGNAMGGKGMISPANKFWHHDGVAFPAFDLKQARETLKKHRYEWDAQGRLYYPPNFKPTLFAAQ